MLKPDLTWTDKFHQMSSLYLQEATLVNYLLHELRMSKKEAQAGLELLDPGRRGALEIMPKSLITAVVHGTLIYSEQEQPKTVKKWPEIRTKQGEKHG